MSTTKKPTRRLLNEPSAWLRGALAAFQNDPDIRVVLELYRRRGCVLVTTLGSGDRTCDRCKVDVSEGPTFWPFMLSPEPDLICIIGLCDACVRHETVEVTQ